MRRTVPRRHLVLLAYPAHGQQKRVGAPWPGDGRGTVNRECKGDDRRCGDQAQPDVLLEARRQTASHILLFGKVAHVLKTAYAGLRWRYLVAPGRPYAACRGAIGHPWYHSAAHMVLRPGDSANSLNVRAASSPSPPRTDAINWDEQARPRAVARRTIASGALCHGTYRRQPCRWPRAD